jgi:hypothetical protein
MEENRWWETPKGRKNGGHGKWEETKSTMRRDNEDQFKKLWRLKFRSRYKKNRSLRKKRDILFFHKWKLFRLSDSFSNTFCPVARVRSMPRLQVRKCWHINESKAGWKARRPFHPAARVWGFKARTSPAREVTEGERKALRSVWEWRLQVFPYYAFPTPVLEIFLIMDIYLKNNTNKKYWFMNINWPKYC